MHNNGQFDNMDHNKLILKCYEGNPHLKHILTNDDINRMALIEGTYPITKFPVCSHCERLGLWTKYGGHVAGWCEYCGTYTKNAMSYSEYLTKGYDVDETGDTFRRMLKVDRERRERNKLLYLPEWNTKVKNLEGDE